MAINISMGNLAGIPVRPINVSIDGTPKWLSDTRAAEIKMDLMKPSAFQIKNGNETKRGMLIRMIVD